MSYIHPDAHASYRHWWEQQTHSLWQALSWKSPCFVVDPIGYLYPHLRKNKRRRRRNYGSSVRRWIRPWDISISGESSFRQNGYEPKVQDDHARSCQDWREKKGFRRDHAKTGHRRFDNAGWYGKKIVHAKRRQHEREMIKHERFDELTQGVQDVVRCWWD